MTDCLQELSLVETSTLLNYYGFELREKSPNQLVAAWEQAYSTYWVRLAVVESLYQGRYKAISVEYILDMWSRLGHPAFHFSHDFERLVCRNIPELAQSSSTGRSLSAVHPKLSLKPIPPKSPVTLTPLYQFFPEMEPPAIEPSANFAPLKSELDIAQAKTSLDSLLSVAVEEGMTVARIANSSTPSNSAIVNSPKAILPQPSNFRTTDSFKAASGTIQGFIPPWDESEHYSKLRAVVHQELAAKMGG
jgi:hypothetical protein